MTPLTVRTKESLALNDPSLTVMVIVAVPFWLAMGVSETVQLDPLPPKTMFPLGTRSGLDERAVRIKLPAAVSTSPTVKAIGAEMSSLAD